MGVHWQMLLVSWRSLSHGWSCVSEEELAPHAFTIGLDEVIK